MKKDTFFALLMLAIIGASFYFLYRVFSPCPVPLAWAFILTLVAYPGYRRLSGWMRNRRSLASLVAANVLWRGSKSSFPRPREDKELLLRRIREMVYATISQHIASVIPGRSVHSSPNALL